MRRIPLFYLTSICAVLLTGVQIFAITDVAYAAYNPLEIINIKPAGTGSPAISPNHRIFRAYPGIEYNIRAAVIGGMYPYRFALSNAPAGMTIDEDSGVIRWANPQASASSIRLTVTDSENSSVSTTWSITVTTSGFIFVDDTYTGTSTGTISQPYKSIQDILNLSSRESDIVYFRSGTYTLPIYQPEYYLNIGCNLAFGGGKPHIWLGYPGENITINMNQHYFEAGFLPTPYYFDGLRFFNAYEYGFRASSSNNYSTFLRCEFDTLSTGRAGGNSNQGYHFTVAQSIGNYLVFQDCSLHDYSGTAGIGSLYLQNKTLIEDCRLYNQIYSNTEICTAIAAKSDIMNSTFRHNYVVIASGTALGAGVNGMFVNGFGNVSRNNEVCFNYFRQTSGSEANRLNNDGDQGALYFYRNTVVGTIMMKFINATGYTNGPFIFDHNVIINSASGLSYHYTCGTNPQQYVTFTNNLTGTSSSNIVDTNGNLTSNYSSYVGTHGWQTVAGMTTPPPPPPPADTTPPQAPSGVTTTIITN